MRGDAYVESIRDGREVWIDGERVKDVATHPAFQPMVEVRRQVYDMAWDDRFRACMTVTEEDGEPCSITAKPPVTVADLRAKRCWVDCVLSEIGGVVFRIGDETIGAVWSMLDCRDALDPQFVANVERHIDQAYREDRFTVSGNTDPKGDRNRHPSEQDPDMLLHVVRETDSGIVVRGAKYETAAAYAHQAFVKPTAADWGRPGMEDYALAFICSLGAPGLRHICRASHIRGRTADDYPSSVRFDEIDTLLVFDDVHVPWENVFFYRDTDTAQRTRETLHRYSALPFVIRIIHLADLLIGAAVFNAEQTGLERNPAVREKLAELAAWRQGLHAGVFTAIEQALPSPGGFMMPHPSTLYATRIHACRNLPKMIHLVRELVGGQISVTPDHAAFAASGTASWMQKFYSLNARWQADDRRRLLAFARDLVNSDHACHRLTFALFAQSPPFAHLAAEFQTFDFDSPKRKVKDAAGLSDRVLAKDTAM